SPHSHLRSRHSPPITPCLQFTLKSCLDFGDALPRLDDSRSPMAKSEGKVITIGVTGASGAAYARAVLCLLEADPRVERVFLVASDAGLRLVASELDVVAAEPKKLPSLIVGAATHKIAYLPKVKVGGVICASARKTPLPVSGTLCGLPTALLAISMLAENAPADCGENVAEILQDKLGARLIGQLFVCRKSAAFGPASPIACAKLRDAFPVLVIVNVSVELCVPTFCDPKSQLSGVT